MIDGVPATFGEATAFHRGVVTLAEIEQLGALSGHAPPFPSSEATGEVASCAGHDGEAARLNVLAESADNPE